MNRKFVCLAACVVQLLVLPCAFAMPHKAAASEQNVWRIGVFNGSSAEFGGSDAQPVVFTVGESKASQDWPGYEQALLPSAKPSPATEPRTIRFRIDRLSRAWRLHVSLLVEQPSVPILRVAVNGRVGDFYLHPKLNNAMGDTVDAFDPVYSEAEVEIELPGSALHMGENSISLQALGEHKTDVSDAGLTYDAISLDRISAYQARLTARLQPTIFYEQRDGVLRERVDLFVRSPRPLHTGYAELEIAGHSYRQTISSPNAFGEARLSFWVPEFSAATVAHMSLRAGGHGVRLTQTIDPQKKWTLYLVPLVHLDLGYTDYQAKVAAIHSRILDEAMGLIAKHPSFRYSTDGSWSVAQYMKLRTPAKQQQLINAIRERHIFVPAQYCNLLTGFPTAETLIRSLYPSADFSRIHDTPFNYANITDVPSYTWSYPSILAAAGIHYFVAASNNDRAPVLLQGHLNEHSPMYWEGPDGGKVLFWYSRHYMQMQFLFGLPPHVAAGEETVPLFLQMYEHPGYRANSVIVYGTQVENTDLFPQQAALAGKWNKVFSYPHIEYSGFHHALKNIAKQFGSDIPTVRGDGGPYWEDGIASDGYYAAIERVNEARAPSAEKLATLNSLVNPGQAADQHELTRMWDNMVLMDEHTWDSWNSVSDPDSQEAIDQLKKKDSHAVDAELQRTQIARSAMDSLVYSMDVGPGNLVVFNPLNWRRSDLVKVDLDNGQEIVDRVTGKVAPYFVLHQYRDFRRVEFLASDVPPLGYKVYHLREAKATAATPAVSHALTLETPYYRVTLDPETGAIRSIYDKQLGKELVNERSPYRFGQYLYVTGGDHGPNSILQYRAVSPEPQLDIHGAANGRLISVERTPWGWRAVMESSDVNTPEVQTQLLLFNHQKKIELIEDVTKKAVRTKEAVYFAFPFAMSSPEFKYEIQNGTVDPAKDMYPGAGHEWFSVQHWVSVEQNGVSATVMPLDASLVTLGDINRGAWPTSFGSRPGNIFSYVMNNYWHTNYRAEQGGHFRFRYIITSASTTDSAKLSRMGWEEATPFEHDFVQSQDKAIEVDSPLNAKEASFLHIGDPDLLLDTWKPAENGHGTILRFLDLGGKARTVTITMPLFTLQRVIQTDAVERDQKPIGLSSPHSFDLAVRPHQILTVRVFATPDFASAGGGTDSMGSE